MKKLTLAIATIALLAGCSTTNSTQTKWNPSQFNKDTANINKIIPKMYIVTITDETHTTNILENPFGSGKTLKCKKDDTSFALNPGEFKVLQKVEFNQTKIKTGEIHCS